METTISFNLDNENPSAIGQFYGSSYNIVRDTLKDYITRHTFVHDNVRICDFMGIIDDLFVRICYRLHAEFFKIFDVPESMLDTVALYNTMAKTFNRCIGSYLHTLENVKRYRPDNHKDIGLEIALCRRLL